MRPDDTSVPCSSSTRVVAFFVIVPTTCSRGPTIEALDGRRLLLVYFRPAIGWLLFKGSLQSNVAGRGFETVEQSRRTRRRRRRRTRRTALRARCRLGRVLLPARV